MQAEVGQREHTIQGRLRVHLVAAVAAGVAALVIVVAAAALVAVLAVTAIRELLEKPLVEDVLARLPRVVVGREALPARHVGRSSHVLTTASSHGNHSMLKARRGDALAHTCWRAGAVIAAR